MSWTKKNVHPGKILSTSQEVDVVVLEVDPTKRRISLGLKQTLENPWQAFAHSHPAGTEVEGEVKNKTEFGLFIGLEGDVDGMSRSLGFRVTGNMEQHRRASVAFTHISHKCHLQPS